MLKEIGGYFSLELQKEGSILPALSGLPLNTGRNSLEYILRSLVGIKKVYIPYYTCDSVLEPFQKLNLSYEFYHINSSLELADSITLNAGEYLVYTNYFGVKDAYVQQLVSVYKDSLIVDNAQALYAEPTTLCAYSPRKFVGIPDGGFAFASNQPCNLQLEKSLSYDLCIHLLKRLDCRASSAYADFKTNSKKLSQRPIQQMSSLTSALIGNIDFKAIAKVRRNNFSYLHQHLSASNQLNIPSIDSFACPMVYPYFVENENLRSQLIAKNIYVATYWPNVFDWCKPKTMEFNLAKYILPLPIDQRYNIDDMCTIIKYING